MDLVVVKLRQGSGKDRQGTALKAKGLKAYTLAVTLKVVATTTTTTTTHHLEVSLHLTNGQTEAR